MMRFIIPAILIGVSVTVFVIFINPIFGDIGQLKTQVTSYNEALDNSKALENERDKLTAKYNSINKDDLFRLQKLLPENIDNIRLILEIEQIALPYGMALKNVKYNTEIKKGEKDSSGVKSIQGPTGSGQSLKDYGVWDLEFSTSGSYKNFLNFTKDLEKNLRIVDVVSVQFSSGVAVESNVLSVESYQYNFKIRTYWLKN